MELGLFVAVRFLWLGLAVLLAAAAIFNREEDSRFTRVQVFALWLASLYALWSLLDLYAFLSRGAS